jgi:predicted MFS family arabinose efflux permease
VKFLCSSGNNKHQEDHQKNLKCFHGLSLRHLVARVSAAAYTIALKYLVKSEAKPYHSSSTIVFWLLTFAYFLSYFFRSTNAVIAPDLTRELKLSAADLGLMTSLFYFAFAISQIPIGLALDRFGTRVVQPVLLGIAVLGSLLFGAANSFWLLAAARMLLGIGLAGSLMAAFKSFGLWFPRERNATVTGALMALGTFGALFAASPLAWLSSISGWRSVFVYGAGLTVLSAVLIAVFMRNTPPGFKVAVISSSSEKFKLDSGLLRISLVNFFAAGGLLSVQTLWGGERFLASVYGLDKNGAGLLLTIMGLGTAAGYLLNGMLGDRFGLARVAVFGLIGFGCCQLMFALQTPLVLMYPIYFLFGAFGTSNLLLLSHAKSLYSIGLTGQVTTFTNMFGIGGTFVLQWLIGVIVGAFSSKPLKLEPFGFTVAFGVLTIGTFASLLLYLPVARGFNNRSD